VELSYGSHDLEALAPNSDRRIFVVRRATDEGQIGTA